MGGLQLSCALAHVFSSKLVFVLFFPFFLLFLFCFFLFFLLFLFSIVSQRYLFLLLSWLVFVAIVFGTSMGETVVEVDVVVSPAA